MSNTAEIRTYDAATAPRGAFRFVTSLLHYPQTVWDNRFLVHNFFRRELLGRFRGSLFGAFWVVAQPLFMFLVYYLVFGMLIGNWKWGTAPDPNFAFYLFSGVIVFSALNEGTTGACASIVGNGNLVKKVRFPSEVLPVHIAAVSCVIFLVGALVFLLARLVCGMLDFAVPSVQPGASLLYLPLTTIVQFVMTLGIGLFLANLYVFARDIRHLWQIFVTAWLFLSPVFWQPHMLANKFPGVAQTFFAVNPAYSLIMAQRIALGATDATITSDQVVEFGDFWTHIGRASLWAAFFLLIGYCTFMSRKHKYADLV